MNDNKLLCQKSQTDLDNYSFSKKVGNYFIGAQIGKGAFATVNEGLHSMIREKVAVKIVNKVLCQKDAYIKKHLRREGKILQKLQHPNIVQLLEIMETENSYYLVMEICQSNLMTKIMRKSRLSETETKFYMKQLISAVTYLHKSAVMHRDLKVENILLTKDDVVKLADFGVSTELPSVAVDTPGFMLKENRNDLEKQLCKTQCGSPAYAAPEVLSKMPYDYSADVWSLGVNMFAMLKGSLPFTVKPFNIEVLLKKIMNKEMNKFPDDLSTDCKTLIIRFLDPEPTSRISLVDAMKSPWFMDEKHFSNVLTDKQLSYNFDYSILRNMEESLGFKKMDIIKDLLRNSPTSAFAIYQLLVHKKSTSFNSSQVLNGILINQNNVQPAASAVHTSKPESQLTAKPLNEITNSDLIKTETDSQNDRTKTTDGVIHINRMKSELLKSRRIKSSKSVEEDDDQKSAYNPKPLFMNNRKYSLIDLKKRPLSYKPSVNSPGGLPSINKNKQSNFSENSRRALSHYNLSRRNTAIGKSVDKAQSEELWKLHRIYLEIKGPRELLDKNVSQKSPKHSSHLC